MRALLPVIALTACNVADSGPFTGVPTWTTEPDPSVGIGSTALDQDSHFFDDVVFAGELSDGRVVVFDAGSAEARWFMPDGVLASRAGREGEGPEEFGRVIGGAVTRGDTLVLIDSGNQRLSLFGANGGFVSTHPAPLANAIGASLSQKRDGDLVLIIQQMVPNIGGNEYNLTQDSVHAVLMSGREALDTVLSLAGSEAVTWVNYVDGAPRGMQQMDLPFAQTTLVAAVGDAVVNLDSRDASFSAKSDRRSSSLIGIGIPQTPISEELRERYATAVTEAAVSAGAPAAMIRNGAESRLALLAGDRTVPIYDRILVDRVNEEIWLRTFTPPWSQDDPQEWWIYDLEGGVVARVVTPPGLNILSVNATRIVGVRRDQLDVEYVEVYSVQRP